MHPPLDQKDKIILFVQFFTSAVLVVFWGGFYFKNSLLPGDSSPYEAYHPALPLPDMILAALLVTAGFLTLKRIRWSKFLTSLAAIIMLIIGVVGFQLELSNGLWLVSMVSLLKSGFVNLWCVVFGFYFLLKPRMENRKKRGSDPKTPSLTE